MSQRWSPLEEILLLKDSLSKMLDHQRQRWTESQVFPSADGWEDEKGYYLCVEVPGMEKEDLDLEVLDTTVTLKGKRPSSPPAGAISHVHMERFTGFFSRSWKFTRAIDPQGVEAELKENGVLIVFLPKVAHEK